MLLNFFKYFYSRHRNLVLYALIGLFSAIIDFFIFTILIKSLEFSFIKANIFSVTVGITTSFILNRNLNFNLKDRTKIRALSFFMVGFSGMFASSLMLGILIHILQISIIYLKIISVLFVVLVQFNLNKYLTFKNLKNG